MRRITPALAMTAGVALFAAACGGGGGGDTGDGDTGTDGGEATEAPVRGDEELVIWTDDLKQEAVRAVAERFAEENDITVGVQAIVAVRQDFITANAAGNGPDVVVGAHDWIGQLVQNGAIDPLQISPADLAGYAENAVEAVTYDGQVYSLPFGTEALALYCNKEYAPDTYATLDDAIAAGQAAVDAGSVDVALAVPQGESGDAYHMQPLYTSAGGYLFGRNAEGDYDPNDLGVGQPASIQAAQKIAELGEAGVLSRSVTGANAISLFATDRNAACLISGPWALTQVRTGLGEDGYTVQPIPGFAGMQPAEPFMGTQGFMVASQGRNKTFAQEFVANGVNNEEAMRELFDLFRLPPAMTAVRESVDDADVETFATAADQAAPMPAIPAMDAVFVPLSQAWAAIIGGADPAETMTQAGQTIADAIASV